MYKFQNNTNEIRAAVISNNNIYFTCPGCGAETTAPASPLRSCYRVKVKCACQHVYIVEINNRARFRKRVDLPAHCFVTRRNRTGELFEQLAITTPNTLTSDKTHNAKVIDLTNKGLGVLSTENQLLKEGDVINLVFTLDNSTETEIRQEFEVKNIINNRIGCSIIGDNLSLDSYLMV